MRYRLSVNKGAHGGHRWQIVDKGTGKTKALSVVNEFYESAGEAAAAGHAFIDGMQRPQTKCAKMLSAAFFAGLLVGVAICRLGGI